MRAFYPNHYEGWDSLDRMLEYHEEILRLASEWDAYDDDWRTEEEIARECSSDTSQEVPTKPSPSAKDSATTGS